MIDESILPVVAYLLIFPVGFALLWLFVIWLSSLLSGWRQLVEVYPERPLQFPTCWKWQSIALRWTASYSGILTVCADDDGVTIAPIWPFRFSHAPFTIPWEEITVLKNKHTVKLRLQRLPDMSVTITRQLAAKWVEAANGRFSDQPIAPF